MFELEERLWWYDGMRAITSAILKDNVIEKNSRRLLDVGCGTGFSLLWLKKLLGPERAIGVDASAHAAPFWRERKLYTNVVASALDLPFGPAEFDLVTCFDVIYQFKESEAEKAISEVYRVLKPGGFIYIREPAYSWMRGAHDIAVGTRHRYTVKQLCGLLRAHQLVPKRRTYANTLLFWAAVPHRLLSRLKGSAESDVKPMPEWMNRRFRAALGLEARLLSRLSFPFGLSAIVLAQKPLASDTP